MTVDQLYEYALTLHGIPYQWGGEGPPKNWGYDCSGFVRALLHKAGIGLGFDTTAEQLYYHYLQHGLKVSSPGRGCLVFFGATRVNHVGWMIDSRVLISAAGGNRSCTTKDVAERLGASVKLQPLSVYSQPVGFLLPKY